MSQNHFTQSFPSFPTWSSFPIQRQPQPFPPVQQMKQIKQENPIKYEFPFQLPHFEIESPKQIKQEKQTEQKKKI